MGILFLLILDSMHKYACLIRLGHFWCDPRVPNPSSMVRAFAHGAMS